MKSILIVGVLLSSIAYAGQNEIMVAGKINFADCSSVVAKPAQKKQQNTCVVSYSGVSEPVVSSDGTRSTTTYEGQIAVMGQEMKPTEIVGKNVFLTIDLIKSEVIAWGQRD
jgi:hypothetical protein